MTYTEDIIQTLKWSVEALQKENEKLNQKLKLQEEKHQQELIDVEIKTRLEINKEKILEEHGK